MNIRFTGAGERAVDVDMSAKNAQREVLRSTELHTRETRVFGPGIAAVNAQQITLSRVFNV